MSFYGREPIAQDISVVGDNMLWTQVTVGGKTYQMKGSNTLNFTGADGIVLTGNDNGMVKTSIEDYSIETSKLSQHRTKTINKAYAGDASIAEMLGDALEASGGLKSGYKYLTVRAIKNEHVQRTVVFVHTPAQTYPINGTNYQWQVLIDIEGPQYDANTSTLKF